MLGVLQFLRGVSEDGSGPARLAVHVDERIALDAVVPLPLDGEVSVGLLDVNGFGIPIPCQGRGEPILAIEQPGIRRLRREQDKLPDRNHSSVVAGCTPLNVAYLIGEAEILAVTHALARSTPYGFSGAAMEPFIKLFGDLLVFVYHCFDRIVIHGYLSGLSRPEQVVHFSSAGSSVSQSSAKRF